MQFEIDQEVLAKAVGSTMGAVDKRSQALPILAHCLVKVGDDGLVISATDLEIQGKGIFPAEVNEEGVFTVHAPILHALVKDLPPGVLTVYQEEGPNHNGGWVRLEAGTSRYRFPTLNPEHFPPLREIEETSLVEVDAKALVEMIDKTVFSASPTSISHINSVLWETEDREGGPYLRLVSTDGHRLSVAERPLAGLEGLNLGEGLLVPLKAIKVIRKFLADRSGNGKVKLGVIAQEGDNAINTLCFKDGSQEMAVRLLSGNFPDYRKIPQEFKVSFGFQRQELMAVLKRLSLLSTDKFRGIILQLPLSGEEAEVTHENPDVGNGREVLKMLKVELLGNDQEDNQRTETLNIGFNARYLLDPLAAMTGETVVMAVNEPDRPIRLTDPSDPDTFFLIMPLSL
ncbi:MAG: DNA polymerase III subunit beta [Deltaproteobacteria bacterium]|nr:DNA polymerase III subunit beta [Deltaproteobacteria bacterium]